MPTCPHRSRTARRLVVACRPLVVACVAWLLTGTAGAETFLYGDPSTFSALNSGTSTSFSLDGMTVSANRLSSFTAGNGLTLGSETITFPAVSPPNPAWIAGVRDMFRLRFSDGGNTTLDGNVTVEYTFPTPLSTGSYLVFADFDYKEIMKIRAYDVANSLIGFGSLSFARQNGREPGGDSLVLPVWRSEAGYSGVIEYGNNPVFGRADPVVTVQSSIPIARLVYESDNDPYDTITNNDLYFNFAIPAAAVPEIDPAGAISVVALLAGVIAIVERRRKAS